MYKDIKIDVTEDIINELDEKFKNRHKQNYQKRIDKMFEKFDIIGAPQFWRKYVESSIIVGYSDYKGDDATTIFETMKFENEMLMYFIYKIIVELFEMISISLNLRVYMLKEFYKTKKYIDDLLMLHSIEKEGGIEKYIQLLDDLFSTINIPGLKLHKNTKNRTKNLLGYEKRNDYRWNTHEDMLDKKVKILQDKQKKNVTCPLCGDMKVVNNDNKGHMFQTKNSKVVFNCNHEHSKYISKKKVAIPIKKADLPDGVDAIDFVLYNWKYFSKKWLEENNHEEK